MSDRPKAKPCEECGAYGVPRDETLCKPCRIGQEHGPEARKRYFQDLAKRGGEATKAKRGRHSLKVDQLPPLEDHRSAKMWLAALAEGVAGGRLSRSLSGEVRKILKTFMAAHRAETTDEVVAEIQAQLDELRSRVEGNDEPWRRG